MFLAAFCISHSISTPFSMTFSPSHPSCCSGTVLQIKMFGLENISFKYLARIKIKYYEIYYPVGVTLCYFPGLTPTKLYFSAWGYSDRY